jgi:hypothetical protein
LTNIGFCGFSVPKKTHRPGVDEPKKAPWLRLEWAPTRRSGRKQPEAKGGTLDAGFNPNPRHDGESEEETMAEGPISGYSKTTTSTSSSNRLVRIQSALRQYLQVAPMKGGVQTTWRWREIHRHLCREGDTGVGKTATILDASHQAGNRLVRHNMSSRVDTEDFHGRWLVAFAKHRFL